MNRIIKKCCAARSLFILLMACHSFAQGAEPPSKEGAFKYSMPASSVNVANLIDSVQRNEKVRIYEFYLDGEVRPLTITLKKVDIFSPDSKIIVVDANNNQYVEYPPKNAYYRGTIEGYDDAIVALTVETSGQIRGLIEYAGEHWNVKQELDLGKAPMPRASVGLVSSRLSNEINPEEKQEEPFSCKNEDERPFSGPKNIVETPLVESASEGESFAEAAMAPSLNLAPGELYEVPVAVETDYEYYSIFNNASTAAAYLGDLFNYTSAIYQRDVSATFKITTTYLYQTSNDPWNNSLTDAGQRLTEFRNYWNTNRSAVNRASAVFLSGRGSMSGIADSYVVSSGVYYAPLCWKSQGYGYAFIGGINRGFNPAAPTPGWDIVAVAHEVGHNFGSPHTHAYANLGGNVNPVDWCYSGDNGSPTGQLPGIGSLSGGTAGAGTGTIMSYCHFNAPGMSNLSLKFGKDHPFGIQAFRVTNLMTERMQRSANLFPGCLSIIGGGTTYTLTVQKSGTGSGTVTGTNINCGSDCSESYTSGTSVSLNAVASTGSSFIGWTGCTSVSGTTCNVSMNADKTVTATFNLSGGTATGLLSAILPSARSVSVGTPATAFGTLINATGVAVTGCYLALPNTPSIPASFSYQTTNASNQLTGTANTPVNIPVGGSQGFVLGITPNAAFNATDIPIVFDCANTVPAPSQAGLNTFLLSASSTPAPDMVAIGATPSGDGVLRVPGSTGIHAFGASAVNIGATGTITATADTGGVSLPLTLTLCQTNPGTGGCLAPPAASVSSSIGNQQVATYAVFAQATGAIAFDPSANRIFLRLSSGGVVRGGTSVAVTTQ